MKLLRRLNLPIRAKSRSVRAEASQSQAETSQPLTEELFKQFQAWAAEEETRAQAGPAQPVQAPTKGDARCPNAGPAREKAPTGPVRAKCTSRDPVPAKSSSKGPGGARCTGTGPARSRPQSTGPVYAKCPDTVAPAKLRFAQLGPAGSVARVSPRIAKGAPMERLLFFDHPGIVGLSGSLPRDRSEIHREQCAGLGKFLD